MDEIKTYNNIFLFGEILYDCFEDGTTVLGGAPFNVAWNLKGLELNPIVVSSIGHDSYGKSAQEAFIKWRLDTQYIKQEPLLSTGKVSISLDTQGVPSYKIEEKSAYDYLEFHSDIPDNSILYHGSLAFRYPHNLQVLQQLKRNKNISLFVDVNLREPYWGKSSLDIILPNTTWLKLNSHELRDIERIYRPNSTMIKHLFHKYNIQKIILTHGENGATIYSNDGYQISATPPTPSSLIDTVGAGDAFSAVCLYGILHNWSDKLILQRASEFASKSCSNRGAITTDKEFYLSTLQGWKNAK